MTPTFLQKAIQLQEAGFWVAGFGHFDISIDELALILELVDKNDFKKLKELYEKLSNERL